MELLGLSALVLAIGAARSGGLSPGLVRPLFPRHSRAAFTATFRANAANQSHPDRIRLSRLQQLHTFFETVPDEENCYRQDSLGFRFFCPTPELGVGADGAGLRYRCISQDQLCNLIPDCPAAEDEDLQSCMFYQTLRYEMRRLREVVGEHFKKEHSALSLPRDEAARQP